MKILIACEFSGRVRDAFIKKGHDAVSCDLLPTESPGPHYQGDVFDIINDGWDMMIAHPPCTFLSIVANRVWNVAGRKERREQALQFFMDLYNVAIPKIAIENPVGYVNRKFRKPNQIIEPYYFGDPVRKKTCLWLKNLPFLDHAKEDNLFMRKTHVEPRPTYISPSGRNIHFIEGLPNTPDRSKIRSKTFPGIAKAMADQWGK
ncbi:MAG: sister chromatid cohesion protein PDS5 [Desulfobacula sp.]|nr:sister chromatid cohesion protein PDS5 [Desulfobacula sp.]